MRVDRKSGVSVDVHISVNAVRKKLKIDQYFRMNPTFRPWHSLILIQDTLAAKLVLDGIRRGFIQYALQNAGTICSPYCQFADVGSRSPTSDIDITVRNAKASLLIRIVHDIYSSLFGDKFGDMSTSLDINIYSNAYYCISDSIVVPIEACKTVFVLDANASREQIRWSLIRLVDMPIFWPDVTLRRKVARMKLTASRRQLEDVVAEYESILASMVISSTPSKLHRYLRAVSMVRALEQEAYMSYGAYAHVVLIMQAGMRGVKLSRLDYIASFFDNLGFLAQHTPTDMKSAKYFDRCVKAAKKADVKLSRDITVCAKLAAGAIDAKRTGNILDPSFAKLQQHMPDNLALMFVEVSRRLLADVF